MCNLNKQPLKQKTAIGYKVVAVHKITGKFYSIAMGFKYKNGLIPIPETQNPISNYFLSNILDKGYRAYNNLMEGRTAIFKEKSGAADLLKRIQPYFDTHREPKWADFEPKIIKVRISIGLLSGHYNGSEVIAGRKIKFLE